MSEASYLDSRFSDGMSEAQMTRLDEADAKRKASGFILICINRGRTLYAQHISQGGYWTRYRDNARLFSTRDEAVFVMKQLKYGKFKIEKF